MNICQPFTRSIILPFLLLLSACQVDVQSEKAQLLKADQAFAAYSIEHGAAAAFTKYLLPGAMQLPAGAHIVMGRDAIANGLLNLDASYLLDWTPVDGEVSQSGDLAWTWGKYRVLEKANREHVVSQGKYLNIWRRNSRNEWRVLIDMGNQSPSTTDAGH